MTECLTETKVCMKCKEGGERINPASQERQQLLLEEVVQSKDKNSLNFGTQRVTLQGSGIGVGGDQPCRTCLVSHSNTTTYVGSTADGDPDALDFLIPKDVVVEIPVRNVNKLSFFGTAGEYIYVLWRD